MGSRYGSIAIFLVIATIVAAVVVIIVRLDLLDTGQPDAPVIVASLDDGELVLLDEPQSITVTISSGSPITTLELFVDDAKISEVIPPYSAERGAWLGSFVWTPEQLGFAQIRVVALDAQGQESSRELQVEVTDDRVRVAAAIRIGVAGIDPLQQFPVDASIRIDVSATGSRSIERFDILLDHDHVASVSPWLQDDGRYLAGFEWTPREAGEKQVTIVAVDADGRTESRTIPVIVLDPDATSQINSDHLKGEQQSQLDQPAGSEPTDDQSEDSVQIESPADGRQFTLDDDFAFDVDIAARNIGPIASALLYITPVAPDNSLGDSVLIHSTEGHDGDYIERVEDVDRFIDRSGTYELQLVVFTPENDRYDHRIAIRVVASATPDNEDDSSQGADIETSNEIDLGIVTARQEDDNPRLLNVSITNSSDRDIGRINVIITVANRINGAELASADVTMGIGSEQLRTIPLDLDLEPGLEVEALVLLQASADANPSNNSYRVNLRPIPEAAQSQQNDDQAAKGDGNQAPRQNEQDVADPGKLTSPTDPGPAPDLALLEVQATSDGYVLLTVINVGDAAATTFAIVMTDDDGTVLETVTRRDADTKSLAPGATEILTSLQPHTGSVMITVVAGSADDERELSNNTTTVQIP